MCFGLESLKTVAQNRDDTDQLGLGRSKHGVRDRGM